MKISAINNINKSFNGLWDKSSRKSDIDPTLNILTIKSEYYYHPFSDETSSQIQSVMETNSSADIIDNKYYINECKICAKAPFTTKEYMDYSKAKTFVPSLKFVDEYSKNKYLTYDYDNQKPAANKLFVA